MKINSIHKTLVLMLSVSITALMVIILLITDIAVDTWVHDEFKRAMHNKVNLLTTLVEENSEGVEFDFAGEFMPEFEGKSDPEYYQLWRNGESFERSDTLNLFSIQTLPYEPLKLNSKLLKDITLPDGRSGLILYYRFIPQVDSDERKGFQAYLKQNDQKQLPMLLAYAVSAEKVNFLMLLIDISFVVAAILVSLIVSFIVKRTVDIGLTPLDELTHNLSKVSLAETSAALVLSEKVIELLPIQDSINSFIEENRKLYSKEQRMTSDIAHELKTPIAELINLAEVSIKFPDDKNLLTTLAPEVLEISKRLDTIVANILLFHRYNNKKFEKNDVFDVVQVVARLAEKHSSVIVTGQPDIVVNSHLFAFETIMTNLIKNACIHRPEETSVNIHIAAQPHDGLVVTVSNTCLSPLTEDELPYLFEPLWQKDNSRTSKENFGLGLSIVKTFVKALGGNIEATLEQNIIHFKLFLPC